MTREELKNKLALLLLEKDIEFDYNIFESSRDGKLRKYFTFRNGGIAIIMNNTKITSITDITFKDETLEIGNDISINYDDVLSLEVL